MRGPLTKADIAYILEAEECIPEWMSWIAYNVDVEKGKVTLMLDAEEFAVQLEVYDPPRRPEIGWFLDIHERYVIEHPDGPYGVPIQLVENQEEIP